MMAALVFNELVLEVKFGDDPAWCLQNKWSTHVKKLVANALRFTCFTNLGIQSVIIVKLLYMLEYF